MGRNNTLKMLSRQPWANIAVSEPDIAQTK